MANIPEDVFLREMQATGVKPRDLTISVWPLAERISDLPASKAIAERIKRQIADEESRHNT